MSLLRYFCISEAGFLIVLLRALLMVKLSFSLKNCLSYEVLPSGIYMDLIVLSATSENR
jgi:hypothetical protein